MKTQSATIKLMLLPKPNKQGLHPIVVRAQWNGRCEKRTGISIPKSSWSDRDMCIKKSYPNSANLNSILQDKLQQVINRKNELETSGTQYHVEDLFTDVAVKEVSKLDYHTLQTSMMKKRGMRYATALNYFAVENRLKEYFKRDNIEITELDADFCMMYGKQLQKEGLKNSSVFNILSKIAAVWNYAIANDIVSPKLYPFKNYSLHQHYKANFKKKSITQEDFERICNILMQYMINSNPENFKTIHSDEGSLAMYVLGYYFGGLALIDMAKLKKSQVEIKKIGKFKYYMFNDVKRSKTNQPVPIIAEQNPIVKFLMNLYMKMDGKYLFPIITDENNEKLLHAEIEGTVKTLNKRLRRITGLDITYYSCRHSFATHYINTEGSNPVHLATLMGRSVNGIFGYVKEIQSVEDIIKERARMGI